MSADRPDDGHPLNDRPIPLHPTIPSSFGASVPSGTRGIIQEIEPTRPEGRIYRVRFLSRETLGEDEAWVGDTDLFAA